MPIWLKEKLFQKKMLQTELLALTDGLKKSELPPLLFGEHHESHAASAFYPSPFETAAVLCMDGVGEWATTSAWLGRGNELTPLWEIPFPHSLGLLYAAFTYYAGFKINSGEYKVMGLAPYGQPKYVKNIYDHLIDLKPDGTFRLNMEYFDYCTGLTMTNRKFDALFGGPPRKPETLADAARDGPGAVHPGSHRRGDAASVPDAAPGDRCRESLSGRGCGSQLRRQRPNPAGRPVQRPVDPAGRRRRRRGRRRRPVRVAPAGGTASQGERPRRCDEGSAARPVPSPTRRSSAS